MSYYTKKSTIKEVIQDGLNLKMTAKELSFKEVLTNSSGEMFVVNMFNLFEKYYELLLDQSIIVVLDDAEYRKYRFNPKLLARDLYGNQELYYLLLRANHIYSVINFDFKELRVFKTNLPKLLNEIMVKESEDYIDNEVSVIKKIHE